MSATFGLHHDLAPSYRTATGGIMVWERRRRRHVDCTDPLQTARLKRAWKRAAQSVTEWVSESTLRDVAEGRLGVRRGRSGPWAENQQAQPGTTRETVSCQLEGHVNSWSASHGKDFLHNPGKISSARCLHKHSGTERDDRRAVNLPPRVSTRGGLAACASRTSFRL